MYDGRFGRVQGKNGNWSSECFDIIELEQGTRTAQNDGCQRARSCCCSQHGYSGGETSETDCVIYNVI